MIKLVSNAIVGILILIALVSEQAGAQQPAPGFVAIPDDIGCSVQGMSFESTVGANGQLNNTGGSVRGVTCWIDSKKPGKKKSIPLASTTISNGMLPTKDFGSFRITPVNSLTSGGLHMAIGADKLQPLREFLRK